MSDVTVIVLAAGEGTRMKSRIPKVLHSLAGRSMVDHVLHAAAAVASRTVVVVGHGADEVTAHVAARWPEVVFARQPLRTPEAPEVPYGTGYAVQVALSALPEGSTGVTLVVTADTPLLTGETLTQVVAAHQASEHAVTVLTGRVADPTGYGRIVRGDAGAVERIVEERDASPQERALTEINSGILVFDSAFLGTALSGLSTDNAKAELYLTDTVSVARTSGQSVGAFLLEDVTQVEGVNDRAQLAALATELNRRIVHDWMLAGVSVTDPATTWIDADVTLEPDVTVLPGVQLLRGTTVSTGATIGPDSTLGACEVGANASVVRTHAEGAHIGPEATVGPFTYLRPGTVLGPRAKAGGFVEIKSSTVGEGAKVPHLSYIGDAEIGEGTNIGAGNITANYDGVAKHKTVVGAHVKTGSHTTLVAPVELGDGSATGAGTVVRRNVPPGGLAVSNAPQRLIERWAQRQRAGTAQAEAAKAAESSDTD